LSAADLHPTGEPWALHIIDGSSQGADGVKLADATGDGRLDIVTGWEEGGIVRAYTHPGPATARQAWPREDIGPAPDVEDAQWVDVDGDGQLEVLACMEGATQQVLLYRRQSEGWQGTPISVLNGQAWMFARPLDVDGDGRQDLVLGSKNDGASIGWLRSPGHGEPADAWQWFPLAPASWIMSIDPHDVDGDGDVDILYSDRRGDTKGLWWLERPDDPTTPWTRHPVWSSDAPKSDLMSFDRGDVDGDGLDDLTLAVADFRVLWLRRTAASLPTWQPITINAQVGAGRTRAAEPGDLDGDGDMDIAVTTWISKKEHGVFWLENDGSPSDGGWRVRAISGTAQGIKYDHSELVDLDEDGDLDLLTCEEREGKHGMGVIWYENPSLP
jgi:hypothetical protein